MKTKEITVHIIAQTQLNCRDVGQWLTDMGVSYNPNIVDRPDFSYAAQNERATWAKFNYPEHTSPGTALTELAGRRCYMAFQVGANNQNLTRIRQDTAAYIDNILSSGHGSVLEHVSYTFAIEGLTRVATAELNRHRAGMAVSEGSGRYIRPSEFGYWLPLSIREQEYGAYLAEHGLSDNEESRQRWHMISAIKARSRGIFNEVFAMMERYYAELEEIWGIDEVQAFKEKKKLTSMFRRVLGQGVSTGGVWTGNLRALRHIFTMRCSDEAEEEICHVATLMLGKMMEAEPEIFGDFEKVDGYWQPKYRKV